MGRVVELPRAATEREWQILVTELRATFSAKGRVASQGEIREWTNGNLHAFLEPTAAGHRLRLGTYNGLATAVTAIGGAGLVIGLLLLATSGLDARTFGTAFETLIPAFLALSGGGTLTWHVFRSRQWAEERERQMEHIAARARALLDGPPTEKDQAV